MINVLVLLLFIGIIGYGVFKLGTINTDYFAKRGLKFVKPYFLFGNIGSFLLGRYTLFEYVVKMYNEFPKEKLNGLFDFWMPVLFLRDPEIIKQLAITDFNHFVDHRTFMDDRSDVLFGNSLLQLRGDKWREMRAALSPSFTGTKMRQMFELVNDCAFDMTEYFKNQSATGKEIHIEMKELFSKYTTDVIASTAFGIKVNSFENSKNEFFVTGSRMLNLDGFKSIAKLILLRTAPWIMKALNIQFLDGCAARFFKKLVLDTIDVRMRNNIFRPDMINILMQLKIGNKAEQQQLDDNDGSDTMNDSKIGSASEERQWTDNEIVAQCFLFFLAGFDTTSTSLSFTAYELGRHPEIQDKLYAEIIETNARLNGKKVTYDDLQKMKYMDQVITESLRFWPPTPVTDRICVKDYDYDDGTLKFRIDKGTMLMIPIYPIHHDAEYYPEPEKFDPERFSDENNHNIRSCTFMPFGVGPRMCLGSRFALMSIKAIIYYLLLNFTFVPNAKSQIPVKLSKSPIFTRTQRGIHLQFVPR